MASSKAKTIYVHASNLAAAVKLNKYKPYSEAVKDAWVHNFPLQVKEASARWAQRMRRSSIVEVHSDMIARLVGHDIEAATAIEDRKERMKSIQHIQESSTAIYDTLALAQLKESPVQGIQGAASAATSLTDVDDRVDTLLSEVKEGMSMITAAASKHPPQEVLPRVQPSLAMSVQREVETCASVVEAMDKLGTMLHTIEATSERINILKVEKQRKVDATASAVNLRRGSRDEGKALTATNLPIKDSNEKLFYMDVDTKPFKVKIGGRVDGFHATSNTIVEVKNRQRRLFRMVPEYEYVQVQAYLRLTGAEKCSFLERLGDDKWTRDIARDDALWNDKVVPNLQAFVEDVIKITEDKDLQDKSV